MVTIVIIKKLSRVNLSMTASLPKTLVTTYMSLAAEDFRPSFVNDDRVSIDQVYAADVRYYRFMYYTVGEKWNWTDRLLLDDSEIAAIMQDPDMAMFVLYFNGAPAGYIELARHEDDSVEIVYFGLRQEYWGHGLGKHLLSFGVVQAFEGDADRVILNTCNLDGPHALKNYQRRGFRIERVVESPMPDKEHIKLNARQKGMY